MSQMVMEPPRESLLACFRQEGVIREELTDSVGEMVDELLDDRDLPVKTGRELVSLTADLMDGIADRLRRYAAGLRRTEHAVLLGAEHGLLGSEIITLLREMND